MDKDLTRISERMKYAGKKTWGAALWGALTAFMLSGCETLSFYSQATQGQLQLLMKREPISAVLADTDQSAELREKLAYLQAVRVFASNELKLPDNASYTEYADLERSHVVWNVVATPRYSVKPEKHCFPIAGCVTYRGYFAKENAKAYAAQLEKQGLDVIVGGVSAYSTLGWFADPILNTMLNRPLPDLAGLLFHELAHQQFYKKGDTTFNESFATAVERAGLQRWLASRGETETLDDVLVRRAKRDEVVALILAQRKALGDAYQRVYETTEGLDKATRDQRLQATKTAGFKRLRQAYTALQESGGGTPGFDRWIERDLNNASLALFADYNTRVPEFAALLQSQNGDWQQFYAAVKALASQE